LTEFGEGLASYAITQGTKFVISDVTDGGEFLEICPGVWPDIDVSNFLYSQSEIALGTSFKMNGHTFFETREVGVSELRVGTQSGQHMFGGAPPAIKQKQIEVIAIQVVVTPSSVAMPADDKQIFDAVVHNASSDTVRWILPTGFTEVALENFGKKITVKSPVSGWDQPVSLCARSLASTGSREGKVETDPRDGCALITPIGDGTITVMPNNICVRIGKTQPFMAIVTGLSDSSVTWTATTGFFTENVYNAPGSPVSEVTITATSVENPQVKGIAIIEVADCVCWWSALVSGESPGAWEGIKAIWQTGLYTAINMAPDDDNSDPAISIILDEPFNGPGEYATVTTMGIGGLIYVGVDDSEAGLIPPTLRIWAGEGTEMVGSMTGQLARAITEEPYYVTIDVNINFRAQDLNQADPCQIPGRR